MLNKSNGNEIRKLRTCPCGEKLHYWQEKYCSLSCLAFYTVDERKAKRNYVPKRPPNPEETHLMSKKGGSKMKVDLDLDLSQSMKVRRSMIVEAVKDRIRIVRERYELITQIPLEEYKQLTESYYAWKA